MEEKKLKLKRDKFKMRKVFNLICMSVQKYAAFMSVQKYAAF